MVEDESGSIVQLVFNGEQVDWGVLAEVGALRCLCVCQAAGLVVVKSWLAGLGSDLSEELVVGVGPATLDCRVVPSCPPGPAARCSSLIMVRQRWSARRLLRHRAASRGVFPSAIL